MNGLDRTAAARAHPPSMADAAAACRVLIVDDSLVMRSVVEKIVEITPGFVVTASVASAEAALVHLAANRADIIILDIEMPQRSGLDALPDLIATSGNARILVLSSHCAEGAPMTLQALALGASDTLSKPGQHLFSHNFIAQLSDRLRMLADAAALSSKTMPPILSRPVSPHSTLGCLAIGSSTGGISAIHELLRALDPRIDAPILITQHLPASFIPYLVRQIGDLGLRPAHMAENGMPLARGQIYCAPGDGHISLTRHGADVQIRLLNDWPDTAYKPSVDPMFTALAYCYGARGAGVMLSGMGNDGLVGAQLLAAHGAPIYAQDPQSSTVWGMPGAIARAGLASVVLPPAGIAEFIADCWLEAI